jgi:hypothetical protein
MNGRFNNGFNDKVPLHIRQFFWGRDDRRDLYTSILSVSIILSTVGKNLSKSWVCEL